MKQVYKYDNNGEFLEPVIIFPDDNDEYIVPEDCTEKPLPQPNYKPKFDKQLNDWVETKPLPIDGFVSPLWDGIDWAETPVPPIDDVTLLKESDAFSILQLTDTQQQLTDTQQQLAETKLSLESSQSAITDLQTQLSQEIQANADLTLQLVMKGVL
jgi:hypothetical protein